MSAPKVLAAPAAGGNSKSPLKVYGVSWCGHCQNQKKTFNTAGLNYQFIDASNNRKITSYPTIVCEQRHVGEMSAADAAKWCPGSVKKAK